MQGRQPFGRVIAARAASAPDQIVVISDPEGRRLTATVVHIRRSRLRNQAGKVRRSAFHPTAAASVT